MEVFWTQYGANVAVLCANFGFGLAYAFLIAWINRKNLLEGYTAISVAFGTFVTLTINQAAHSHDPLTDLAWEFAGFAASGLPMIVNNLREHYLAKLAERKAIAEVMEDG